jgi:hypothetical protein
VSEVRAVVLLLFMLVLLTAAFSLFVCLVRFAEHVIRPRSEIVSAPGDAASADPETSS